MRLKIKASQQRSPAAAVEAAPGGGEAIDAERVARIRKAIREGSFTVDAETVAERLLEAARELLDRRH